MTQELSANVHFTLFSIVLCTMGTEEDFGFDTSQVEVPVSTHFKILLNLKVFFLWERTVLFTLLVANSVLSIYIKEFTPFKKVFYMDRKTVKPFESLVKQ